MPWMQPDNRIKGVGKACGAPHPSLLPGTAQGPSRDGSDAFRPASRLSTIATTRLDDRRHPMPLWSGTKVSVFASVLLVPLHPSHGRGKP